MLRWSAVCRQGPTVSVMTLDPWRDWLLPDSHGFYAWVFGALEVISEGVQVRIGCQFIGSLFRSLAKLPGGLERFVPGKLGPHLSRLRHLGWTQCGHGLSSRPLESSLPGCLGSVLSLLGYQSATVNLLANERLKQ